MRETKDVLLMTRLMMDYYDLVDKLKAKYSGVEEVLSTDLVMKATQNISFISINNPPIKIYHNETKCHDVDEYVFYKNKHPLHWIAGRLGWATELYAKKRMKKVKFSIISMPYKYVDETMKINGKLVLGFEFDRNEKFKSIEQCLRRQGYRYVGKQHPSDTLDYGDHGFPFERDEDDDDWLSGSGAIGMDESCDDTSNEESLYEYDEDYDLSGLTYF